MFSNDRDRVYKSDDDDDDSDDSDDNDDDGEDDIDDCDGNETDFRSMVN